jgi:hypothetical protein
LWQESSSLGLAAFPKHAITAAGLLIAGENQTMAGSGVKYPYGWN